VGAATASPDAGEAEDAAADVVPVVPDESSDEQADIPSARTTAPTATTDLPMADVPFRGLRIITTNPFVTQNREETARQVGKANMRISVVRGVVYADSQSAESVSRRRIRAVPVALIDLIGRRRT
jgi:hypothetical protein